MRQRIVRCVVVVLGVWLLAGGHPVLAASNPAPQVWIVSPTTGTTLSPGPFDVVVGFSADAADRNKPTGNVRDIDLLIDGVLIETKTNPPSVKTGTMTFTVVLSPAPEGDIVVTAAAYQGNRRAGHRTESQPIVLRADRRPPVVTWGEPANGATLAACSPTVARFTFSDEGSGVAPAGLHLLVDGVDVSSQLQVNGAAASYTPSALDAEGLHTYDAWAIDRAGNVSEHAVATVTVARPVTVIRTPVAIEGPRPSPRAQVMTAYDAVSDRLILSGGNSYGSMYSDLWILQNASGANGAPAWQSIVPTGDTPPVREGSAHGYDPVSNRMVLHAGWPGDTDTWVITHANGLGGQPAWVRLPSTTTPRWGSASAYDPTSNRLIVFGGWESRGYDYGPGLNDVSILTDANGIGQPAWLPITPLGTPPDGRYYAAVAYDSAANRLIVHGGQRSDGVLLNDLWVLTHANGIGGTPTWIPLDSATGPSPRLGHRMAWDGVNGRAIVVGGYAGQYPYSNEVWVLTGVGETGSLPLWRLATPSGPDFEGNLTFGFGLVPETGRFIMTMGGVGPSYRDDTWHLDLGFTCGR